MSKRHIILLSALVVIGLGSALFWPIEVWVLAAAAQLKGYGAAGVAAFAVLYVLFSVLLVPTSALSITAGLLYGLWAIPMVWTCLMVAAAVSIPIGSFLLRGLRSYLLAHSRRLRLLDDIVEEEGWRAVLLVRLGGIAPFAVQNYALAATRIPAGPYLLASAVGIVPGVLLFTASGALGQSVIENGLGMGLTTAAAGVGFLAALALVAIAGRKIRARLLHDRQTSRV